MTTITIPPTKDTKIRYLVPNSNYGSDTLINIGRSNAPDFLRGLIAFNIPFIDGIITKATLYMYKYYFDDVCELHLLTSDFNEMEATWNKSTSTTNWIMPGGDYEPTILSIDILGTAIWSAFDVPIYSVIDNEDSIGFLLKIKDEELPPNRYAYFYSRESPINPPYLQITYEPSTCSQLICNLTIKP